MGANRLPLFCKTTETETFSRMFGKDRVHRSGVAFKEIFAKKSLSIGVDALKNVICESRHFSWRIFPTYSTKLQMRI